MDTRGKIANLAVPLGLEAVRRGERSIPDVAVGHATAYHGPHFGMQDSRIVE